jgi:hypothetical protein
METPSAAEMMRRRSFLQAIPAHGHMPFVGHRTVAQVDNTRESARLRAMKAYGYDPGSVRG